MRSGAGQRSGSKHQGKRFFLMAQTVRNGRGAAGLTSLLRVGRSGTSAGFPGGLILNLTNIRRTIFSGSGGENFPVFWPVEALERLIKRHWRLRALWEHRTPVFTTYRVPSLAQRLEGRSCCSRSASKQRATQGAIIPTPHLRDQDLVFTKPIRLPLKCSILYITIFIYTLKAPATRWFLL